MMKNQLLLSMLFALSFLFFFLANFGEAAVRCNTVEAKAAACAGFVTGKNAKPSAGCCKGLKQIAQSMKSVADKRAICRCLKSAAKSRGIQDKFLRKLPQACKVKVGFPVSLKTNCDKIRYVMKEEAP